MAQAVRVDRAPRLDGTLNDPLWQSGKPITDFRQREPREGEAATEKTEVRILYTRHAVYFGIHCFDSASSRIIATELRRDVSQELDDHFEILIDSNLDRRDAYVFQINPLGTQIDGLIIGEQNNSQGVDFDSGWDGVWISEARITMSPTSAPCCPCTNNPSTAGFNTRRLRPKQTLRHPLALCKNCAETLSFPSIGVSFERKADAPICWKH